MCPHHPWTRKPHHLSYLFAPIPLIAMHRTFRTRRFFRAEAAAAQAQVGVFPKALAFRTEVFPLTMPILAITPHHGREGQPLALPPFGLKAARGPVGIGPRHLLNFIARNDAFHTCSVPSDPAGNLDPGQSAEEQSLPGSLDFLLSTRGEMRNRGTQNQP
jgi:hypothetical protein